MIRISFLLLVGLAGVLGQFSEYESPLPPRPVIPGALPVGGGGGGGRRPALRVPGAPRRAEGGGRGAAPRRPAPQELPGGPLPRRLPPSEGLAPRRLPTPPPLPPRPVVEEEEDGSFESTTLPSLPPPPFRPAIFRPPVDEDFPQPTRPQFNRQGQFAEEDVSPVGINRAAPRPAVEEVAVRRPVGGPQEAPPRPRPAPQLRPVPAPQPQRTQPQRTRPVPQEQPQARPAPARQSNRQQQVVQRPEKEYTKASEQSLPRSRKPISQVLRKYREDNPDGSITWGFENDDGTFKEETIGVDCVTRGKYGYIDPDGVRREFTYSSGLPCDKDRDAQSGASDQGYIDYSNNKYVLPNGDSIELSNMVKNRARKPVPYRN